MATFIQILLGISRHTPRPVTVEELETELQSARSELNVALWKLEKKGLVLRRENRDIREYVMAPDGETYLRERGLDPPSGAPKPAISSRAPEPGTSDTGTTASLTETLKLIDQQDDYRLILGFLTWLADQRQLLPLVAAPDAQALRTTVLDYLGIDAEALRREREALRQVHDLVDL